MFAQSMFEIVFSCGEEMETPVQFKEAWNHNDNVEKKKWREAIMHELKCMKKEKCGTLSTQIKNQGQLD